MNNEQVKQAIELIANHWGVESQEFKMLEELGELACALSRLQQKVLLIAKEEALPDERKIEELMKNVIYELADVDILKEQLIYLYEAEEEFKNAIDYKLARTLDRIDSGYYN